MSKTNSTNLPDVNQLIIEKLQSYPTAVSELAIKAIQLSEDLPEPSVTETLHSLIRDYVRKDGGNS